MKKLSLLLLISCLFFTPWFITNNDSKPEVNFYDTSFLKNAPLAKEALIERGFQEVNFITEDNHIINGLLLDQSHQREIKATLIICAGFFPGQKESMATYTEA